MENKSLDKEIKQFVAFKVGDQNMVLIFIRYLL